MKHSLLLIEQFCTLTFGTCAPPPILRESKNHNSAWHFNNFCKKSVLILIEIVVMFWVLYKILFTSKFELLQATCSILLERNMAKPSLFTQT